MKTKDWLRLATLCGVVLVPASVLAAETAVVAGDNVNVRSRPSLAGEIITRLNKGEIVTVQEDIAVKEPGPGEPAKWSKIAMPAGTPVWVHADYVDPTTKTVVPALLNLRAGPSEFHGIVGRIERGTEVHEISMQGQWMEIEAPTNAYAFVASELLALTPTAAAPSPSVPPATPPQETTNLVVEPSPPVTESPTEQTVTTVPPPTPTEPSGETTAVAPPAPTTPLERSPIEQAVAQIQLPPPTEETPVPEPAPPRRVVRREGIVRGTVSIQAPTYYQLNNVDTGRVMEYLYPAALGVALKPLNGKRVVVAGEEVIDPRWPNTPILEIETIEVTP